MTERRRRVRNREGELPNVTEQRTSVENILSAERSSVTADVRITITLDNGDTYTTFRRMRLLRDKRAS